SCFHHVDPPDNVHGCIQCRVVHANGDACLSSLVRYCFWLEISKCPERPIAIANVDFVEMNPRGDVFALPGAEIVESGHFMSRIERALDDVATDESGTAGN